MRSVNIADIDFVLFVFMVIIVVIVITCICCTDPQRETTTDQDPEEMIAPETPDPIELSRRKYFQTIRPFQNVIEIPDSRLIERIIAESKIHIMGLNYCPKCGTEIPTEMRTSVGTGSTDVICEFCEFRIGVYW